MIDLHLHLDGSLDSSSIITLAKKAGVVLSTYDESALDELLCAKNARSLNEYLERFELPLQVLQTQENIALAVEMLGDKLINLGYKYAEVRFAPLLHTKNLIFNQVAESAILGLNKINQKSDFKMNLIFCCMRGASFRDNVATIELASAYKNKGVVGVDLAGAEALYPTNSYKELFSRANDLGLNITIHAGEADGVSSVIAALELGAKRIGHGVAIANDVRLMQKVKSQDVLIECCPTSNLQTKAVIDIKKHPLPLFIANGIPCAVCADNMEVSGVDVFTEIALVRREFGLTDDIIRSLYKNAIIHSFASEEDKKKLLTSLK